MFITRCFYRGVRSLSAPPSINPVQSRHKREVGMVSNLKKTAVLSLCVVSLFLFSRSAYACHVNDSAFDPRYRCNTGGCNLNEELNDYARILADADSSDLNCVQQAGTKLTDKLNDTPTTVWNQWLEGALVGLAFAAADQIAAKGYDTMALDAALDRVHGAFTTIGRDPTCATNSLNQCQDDFFVGAPGFAWEAAWYRRKGDPFSDVWLLQLKSIGALQDGFSHICIRRLPAYEWESYCNGSVNDLENPNVTAATASFNHGVRMQSYGYGLMTSAVNAVLGLEKSQWPYQVFDADKQKIARALAKEMQLHTSNSEFTSDCEKSLFPDANGNFVYGYCGGPDNYSAHMYELKEAYDTYFGGMPMGGFQGDTSSFDIDKFDLQPWEGGFFSWGRYIYYYTMSYDWVVNPRP